MSNIGFGKLDTTTSVLGPGSSTDNAAVRWDGTSGTMVQDSGVIISDADDITGVNSITLAVPLVVSSGGSGAGTTVSP